MELILGRYYRKWRRLAAGLKTVAKLGLGTEGGNIAGAAIGILPGNISNGGLNIAEELTSYSIVEAGGGDGRVNNSTRGL